MKSPYVKNFDGITAGDEAKRNTIDALERQINARQAAEQLSKTAKLSQGLSKEAAAHPDSAACAHTAAKPGKKRFSRRLRVAVSIAAAVVLVFSAVLIPIALNNRVSAAMLANSELDLSGVKGLGIARTAKASKDAGASGAGNYFGSPMLGLSVLPRLGSFSLAGILPGGQPKDKNWMVVYDQNGGIEDVIFSRQMPDGESQEITQVKLSAPIKKLYVTEKFTFIMFSFLIDGSPDAAKSQRYHESGYTCHPSHSQSFVIDNSTGKVYSLEKLFNEYKTVVFMDVFEDCVQIEHAPPGSPVERIFYMLDINQDGELVYELLRAQHNNNIYFVTDKFRQYYVASNVSEVSGRVFSFDAGVDPESYFSNVELNSQPFTGTLYGKGSDGYVYKATVSGSEDLGDRQYKIMQMGQGFEELEISADIDISIYFMSEQYGPDVSSRQIFLLKGSKLFHVFLDNGQDIATADLEGGVYRESGRVSLPGGYGKGRPKDARSFIQVYDGEVYYMGRLGESPPAGERATHTLYHYDLLSGVESVVISGIEQAWITRQGFLAYNGAVLGKDSGVPQEHYATKIYRISCQDGSPGAELLFEIPQDRELVTLQPLA